MDSDVADSRQSIILQQVENGVAVRMASFIYLLSGKTSTELNKLQVKKIYPNSCFVYLSLFFVLQQRCR